MSCPFTASSLAFRPLPSSDGYANSCHYTRVFILVIIVNNSHMHYTGSSFRTQTTTPFTSDILCSLQTAAGFMCTHRLKMPRLTSCCYSHTKGTQCYYEHPIYGTPHIYNIMSRTCTTHLPDINTQGTKRKVQLTEVPKYTIHKLYTSVMGPRMLFKLVKDSTKGIVDRESTVDIIHTPASVIFCCRTYLMLESAATSMGILSSWLMVTRLAPWSMSMLIICRLPVAAAAWSGVQPSTSRASSSAPCSRITSASSTVLSIQHCTREGGRGRGEYILGSRRLHFCVYDSNSVESP